MARGLVPPATAAPRAESSSPGRCSPSEPRPQSLQIPHLMLGRGDGTCPQGSREGHRTGATGKPLANSKMLGYCSVTTPLLLTLQHGPLGKTGPHRECIQCTDEQGSNPSPTASHCVNLCKALAYHPVPRSPHL